MTKPNRYLDNLTGIEREQLREGQRKLERKRWDREHFSDGTPVAIYEQDAKYHKDNTDTCALLEALNVEHTK